MRVVEPHCHGISTAGRETLRAYQVSGYSRSGVGTGWKPFTVAAMRNVKVTGASFPGPRPRYRQNDSMMRTIHCQL